jgi:hypothetical protein
MKFSSLKLCSAKNFQRLRVFFQLQNPLLTTIMVYQFGNATHLARNQNILLWHRNFTRNSLVLNYNTYRIMMHSRRTIKWSGSRDQTIHQARSHPWIVQLPFSLIWHPFMKTAKSIGNIAWNFPPWLKQSHTNSPSIPSGITEMPLSTSAQEGPSYTSVTAK